MRTRGGICAAAAVAAIVLLAAQVTSASSLAGNRRAARADVRRLLGTLNLPAGATRSATEPRGDNGYLKPGLGLVGTTAGTVAHAWWVLPGSSSSVYAYIRAHPPAGSKLYSTGGGGNLYTGTTSQGVTFAFPDVPGRIGLRELQVTTTVIPGGQTGVLAESEDVWIVPRPRRERVPAGAHVLDVAVTTGAGAPLGSATVTAPAKLRRTIAFLDGLGTVQPYAVNCPAEMSSPAVLTLTFRADATGAPLAVASFADQFGWDSGSYECDPVQFSVGGHAEPALLGGAYVKTLRRVLGPGAGLPK